MDLKGIDFPGLNPFISTLIKGEKKETPALKPVEQAGGSLFRTLMEGEERPELIEQLRSMSGEERAKAAAEVLAHHLNARDDLDVQWRFIGEIGQFVVEIKDKSTGQVVRQIPPEALLGIDIDELDAGILLNTTL